MSKCNKLIISTINTQPLSIKSKIFNASSLLYGMFSFHDSRIEGKQTKETRGNIYCFSWHKQVIDFSCVKNRDLKYEKQCIML